MMPQDSQHIVLPSAPAYVNGDQGGEVRMVGRLDGGTSGDVETQVAIHGVLGIPKEL